VKNNFDWLAGDYVWRFNDFSNGGGSRSPFLSGSLYKLRV
jgi:hypothetical protein